MYLFGVVDHDVHKLIKTLKQEKSVPAVEMIGTSPHSQ